jgi:hypothetical protein
VTAGTRRPRNPPGAGAEIAATAATLAYNVAISQVTSGTGYVMANTGAAASMTSILFGASHVLPTLRTLPLNPAGARAHGNPKRAAGAVGAAVTATALAGYGLAWLRFRSGSLAAPVVAHAALNATAYLAARSVVDATSDSYRTATMTSTRGMWTIPRAHRSFLEKSCRKNWNTFSASRKIDAAISGAESISFERRSRWKSDMVRPAKITSPRIE